MPEGLEAELWRRDAEALIGRVVRDVRVDERVAPHDLRDLIVAATIEAVDRIGKVVLLRTDAATVGLHFGMTGRLVVDGRSSIDRLEYSSGADRGEWDRLELWTDPSPYSDDVPALRLNDPRRLGRITVDPDVGHLGPDVLVAAAAVVRAAIATAAARRRSALKAVLLDQAVVAGLGNLCVDEVLFTAGIDPRRSVDSLSERDVDLLVDAIAEVLPPMLVAGGSTHGTLDPDRRRYLGPCPQDGAALERATVGGRTTVWCAAHQR